MLRGKVVKKRGSGSTSRPAIPSCHPERSEGSLPSRAVIPSAARITAIPSCHPERSEGSLQAHVPKEILRCAQDDSPARAGLSLLALEQQPDEGDELFSLLRE